MDRDWVQLLKSEAEKGYFKDLMLRLEDEESKYTIFPDRDNIYRAFELTPLKAVRCVIIGQDPYFNPGEAHGLAFSVRDGVKTPPSLRNILKELNSDLGIERSLTDLSDWAESGVLLINRVLTVRKGEPNSHKNMGWMEFTQKVVEEVSRVNSSVVFMLWGAEAQRLKKLINPDHLILEAPHPSPLSSYRGFFGCRHFSMCNDFLKERGEDIIEWGGLNG